MNDADFPVAKVLEGIDAAASAGLAPIKVNMVVKRGVNDHQVVDMARHFRGSGHIVRYIEFMDVGSTNGWRMDDVIPSAEIVRRIAAQFPLEPAEANYRGEVAERWRYLDGGGEIGVISSVTEAFCSTCTRARLSTDGHLYTAFSRSAATTEVDAARGRGRRRFPGRRGIWQRRDDRYSEIRTAERPAAARSRVVHRG